MTFITHGFRVSVVSDVRERVRDFRNTFALYVETNITFSINWFKVNKMQANPDKFQVLAVGKKTFDKNMKICIQNSTLSCEETVKLLGIEIDYQLNFDIHISSICRKASQQLNILKRLGRYLDRLSKLTLFHTFILSNFNFWLGIFVPKKIRESAGKSTSLCIR